MKLFFALLTKRFVLFLALFAAFLSFRLFVRFAFLRNESLSFIYSIRSADSHSGFIFGKIKVLTRICSSSVFSTLVYKLSHLASTIMGKT